MPADFHHQSFSVAQKNAEEEQDLDKTKVHGVNANNESQLLYNLDHVDQNSDEEREIKLPVIKMKDNFSSFNKNMSGSVFGQKRKSYLNHD